MNFKFVSRMILDDIVLFHNTHIGTKYFEEYLPFKIK